jgi:hypothetical protein
MKAQTIQIDSTFTTDGEIFPFSPNDTIYGLSISGSVNLHSDTSLVRVILTDNAGNEWMVYEAYPMIVTDTVFDLKDECDETCFLDAPVPISISVQIINADLYISNFSVSTEEFQDMQILHFQAKRNKDLEKVLLINQYIVANGWNWTADTSELMKMFYSFKMKQFGIKYNLLGLDYYNSGVFKDIKSSELIRDNSSLTGAFDWRTKHNANVPDTKYWDGNPDLPQTGNGWMTKVKNQFPCGACTAFGCVAALEAMTNLYYNYHVDAEEDLLLSERDAFNCSQYESYSPYVGCLCLPTWGKKIPLVIDYITDFGIVNEECFPWIPSESCCNGEIPDCSPINSGKCEEEDIRVIIKPDGYHHENKYPTETLIERLKTSLLNYGPIICEFQWGSDRHVMALVGFGEDEISRELYWILKDSQGTLNPPGGYRKFAHSYFVNNLRGPFYYYDNLLITDPIDYLVRRAYDKDQDGYWNWGIGNRPQDYNCSDREDWNDNNERIGPCDENFIEQAVKPEMQVTLGILSPVQVNNNDIIYITGNSSTDIYYTFRVSNSGDAQLNFQKVSIPIPPHAYIEIDSQYPGDSFEYDGSDYLDTAICMYSEETFKIKLKRGAQPGDLAHFRIHLDEIDIDDFEFTLIFNSCETVTGVDEINTVQTWSDTYRTQLKDIHITDRGILTISGTVFLSPDVDIVVERNGKLIIDGGKLTGTCGNLWNGIDIWGNASMPQEPAYQGTVEILNGGIIEFADTAISTYKTNGSSLVYTGGIIHSADAFFKNNYVGICLSPYSNPNGGGNKSTFKRSKFITTDDYYQPGNVVRTSPKCGLQMSWVNGVNFEGCSFINNSKAEKRKRGIGILNMDADFHVKNACLVDNQTGCEPTVPCWFEGLDYGIKSLNVWSFRRMSVESAEFIDNYKGICLSMNLDAALVNNIFYLNADDEYFSNGDTLVGIYTDVCSRYQMEINKFIGDDPEHFELVGMHILNSGEDYNEVYDNYFENLDYGVIAAGRNKNKDGSSGLCIKCNDFTKCGIDVFVTPGGYDPKLSGIATNQGEKNIYPAHEPDLAAGNTFSDLIDDENNYWNDKSLTMLQYVHHNTESTDENVLPAYYTNIYPDQDEYAAYSKDRSCPSNLEREGLTLSEERSQFDQENSSVASLEDSINVIIDEGDTPGLNFEILTSFPDDALQLHQDLLDISPYLSDTIIKSAIERENVLLNAMVRDVLVANPQAAKEPSIMAKLDERLNPLPGYMMEEIAEGKQYYGAKELVLQDLAYHKKSMAKSLSNIAWLLKQDTTASRVSDSLISLFASIEQINAKYESAFLYLSKKDTVSAISILNDISQQFDLDAPLQNEHELYLELFDLVPVLLADSCVIDSAFIQRLFNLANSENSLPETYSRNLLEAKNLLFYDEPVYLANMPTKGYSIVSSNKDNEDAKSPYLEIFPNPSNTFFIIKYDLKESNSPGTILISDQSGKILQVFSINDQQNQKIVETKMFSPGMYIVSLHVNGNLKAKARLIIR